MAARVRSRLSYANVMATIAVFIALGGGAYAAIKLPANSVGSRQIKANAISSSKVKPRSLLASDFRAGQLPRGRQGPQGAQGSQGLPGTNGAAGPTGASGTPGEPGSAAAYARLGADGVLDAGSPPQNKNVTQTMVQHNPGATNPGPPVLTGDGVYCFGGLPFTPRNAVVTAGNADTFGGSTFNRFATVAVQRGQNLGRCDANHQQVRVVMVDTTGALVDHPFYIWFED
jgi:hypothetical protein